MSQSTNRGGTALEAEALARRIAAVALERKASDVVIIDVRRRSGYTDFLVIASGTSDRHVQSVAELVIEALKREGVAVAGSEGIRGGQWALIDFADVVVHVFHQFTRSVYNLEDLWAGAPRLTVDEALSTSPSTPYPAT